MWVRRITGSRSGLKLLIIAETIEGLHDVGGGNVIAHLSGNNWMELKILGPLLMWHNL